METLAYYYLNSLLLRRQDRDASLVITGLSVRVRAVMSDGETDISLDWLGDVTVSVSQDGCQPVFGKRNEDRQRLPRGWWRAALNGRTRMVAWS